MLTDKKIAGGNLRKGCSETVAQHGKNNVKQSSLNVRILFNPGPQLFIAEWLSRHNHNVNSHEQITCMTLSFNVLQTCKSFQKTAKEIQLPSICNKYIGIFGRLCIVWLAINRNKSL